MPLMLQAKILRVLQEKEVQRIGDSKTRKINCRIISATNKLPSEAVRNNELREGTCIIDFLPAWSGFPHCENGMKIYLC